MFLLVFNYFYFEKFFLLCLCTEIVTPVNAPTPLNTPTWLGPEVGVLSGVHCIAIIDMQSHEQGGFEFRKKVLGKVG